MFLVIQKEEREHVCIRSNDNIPCFAVCEKSRGILKYITRLFREKHFVIYKVE